MVVWREGRYWYACSIAVIELMRVDLSESFRMERMESRIWSESGEGTAAFASWGLPKGMF